MLEKISNKLLNVLSNKEMSDEQKEVLLFGITRIVEDIPKTIGILLIGFMLGILKEILVVTLVMIAYKTFVGGVHAKTNIGCFAYSVLFYLVTIYSAKYLYFNSYMQSLLLVFIYVFCLYTIILYVPADVPEIPKINIKLRKSLKIKSVVALNLIYVISLFIVTNLTLRYLIIYSLFYISLMTTRIIYKLFRTQYGYECYSPDELI